MDCRSEEGKRDNISNHITSINTRTAHTINLIEKQITEASKLYVNTLVGYVNFQLKCSGSMQSPQILALILKVLHIAPKVKV
jgi:hypothetical protein